jgi:hypothetical protein
MNWKYLCGGCVLGGALMLKAGAPLIAVLGGIAMAVVWNLWKKRAETL